MPPRMGGPLGPRGFLTEEEEANKPVVTMGLLKRIFSYIKPYWRGSIKLGSTRREVEDAFSRVRKDPAQPDGYFDSLWAVWFGYNDENIVEQIILYSKV